jgi:DNA-binding MarR family transcriptional regulator
MQLLPEATNWPQATAEACAEELLDALPPVMRVVRRHMRGHKQGLSVPQFRTLALLRAAPAVNLSAVADILNASLPTASRVVSGLVDKGLIDRSESASDRRQVELVLTPRGRSLVDTARRAAQGKLAATLGELSEADRRCLVHALQTLRAVFVPGLRAMCGEHACADRTSPSSKSSRNRRRLRRPQVTS